MAVNVAYPDVYLEAIEQELRSVVQSFPFPISSPLNEDFRNILQYHLGWTDQRGQLVASESGKRLRPLVCLLSCEAASGTLAGEPGCNWREAIPAAAAIELVHNFSLIHDDIQDNSSERRGRPSVWKVWGMAQGINAGDAMFVLSHLALDRVFDRLAPATSADVHRMIDAATLALTQGQFLDLCFESRDDVTVADYLQMVQGKTAALIAAAAQIGARIGTDNSRLTDAFSDYGTNLGVAFQISDDILGIWGDPAVTGKSVGGDLLARKKSFPLVAAAQLDRGGVIKEYFGKGEVTAADVDEIYAHLNRLNALEFAQSKANEYVDRALTSLAETGLSNAAVDHLRDLARGSVKRQK